MIRSFQENGNNQTVIDRGYKPGDVIEEWYTNGIIQKSTCNGVVNYDVNQ